MNQVLVTDITLFVNSVANFLTRSAVDRIIKESREPDADILVTVFVNAIVAIGYHTTCLRGQEVLGVDEMRDSRLRLSSVLALHTKIQTLPSSLVKLQVVIARMCDESLVWDKIIAAVSCARELRLVHTARIQQPSLNAEDQELAQRSVWFLYSLETDYAIHHGMLPMLDLEWETRFPSFGRGDDMIAVSYTYSELLHSVLKFQYSPRALAKSSSAYHLKDRLQASCHALNEWISRLPAPLNEACDAKNLQDIKDDRQLREAFRVFCMYHRAIFFIHCPWISATSPDGMKSFRVAELTRKKCAERCIESAFAVVKLANCGLFWEKGLDRDLSSSSQWGDMGQLLLVSLCFIVHYLVNGDQCNRSTAMPYLAICGGLFGRLSLESDEGSLLDHYLELVQIVRATVMSRSFLERHKPSILVLASQFSAAALNGLAKFFETSDDPVHPFQVLFVRFLITGLASALYLGYTRAPNFPLGLSELRPLLALRAIAGVFGAFGFFFSIMYLKLSEATALNFLGPLAAMILTRYLHFGTFGVIDRIGALIALSGVVLVVQPDALFGPQSTLANPMQQNADESVKSRMTGVGFGLVGVCGGSVALTAIRSIGTREHPMVSVMYFAWTVVTITTVAFFLVESLHLTTTVLSWLKLVPLGIFGFAMVSQLIYVLIIATALKDRQECLLTAGIAEDGSSVAIIMIYSQVAWALLLDQVVWHSKINTLSLVGIGSVVSSLVIVSSAKEWGWIRKSRYNVVLQDSSDEEVAVDVEVIEVRPNNSIA
ncbi:integral membrane protein DUF6 [Colletotrichum eremochloae]|nr:integral membrane protein DUF6 [Colletotrichum eremochloae]